MNTEDFIFKNHEDRLKTLEMTSANLITAVEKQSLMIGLMAKAMMGSVGIAGAALIGAILRVVLKI